MKFFMVFIVCCAFAFGQVDYPRQLSSNSDIISYLSKVDVEGELGPLRYIVLKDQLDNSKLNIAEKIFLRNLDKKILKIKSDNPIFIESLTEQEALQLIGLSGSKNPDDYRYSKKAKRVYKKAKRKIRLAKNARKLSRNQLRSLVFKNTKPDNYRNGEYEKTVRLFLFCRNDRSYPCLFAMKDIWGEFVRKNDGELWTLPALAKSKRGITYNKTNGNTPTGVHTIDSVMPTANRQPAFGKFRRLILNWIPKENNKDLTTELLPKSHKRLQWWRQASIARDVGRKYLRIHGTGRFNSEADSTFYPHVPTSGCISTREGNYPEDTYIDQRKILDQMMIASQMAPVFTNEVNLKGVLFVVNLDKKKLPVTKKDLVRFGLR